MTTVGAIMPRRILLTADTVGGVWIYAVELARALSARGIEVVLATMGAPVALRQRADLRGARRVALRESAYRLEWMAEPWADVDAAGEWLLALERDLRPDVVHLNQLAFGALPWRAPRLVAGHSCVCSWWRAVHRTDAPPEWDEYRRRARAGIAGADLVVAPTVAMLGALERYYGPLGRAVVIPNARTPRLFRRGRKDELILAAGRLWDDAKNVAALAKVAPDLPWPVYVAGDTRPPAGAHGNQVAARVTALRLLGPLPARALARWLRRAAIYALPARYEPFGLSVLEAAHAGCALVLGDIPSLRELWNGAALFVPPDDTGALRSTLRALTLRHDLRTQLADAAERRARQFTTERFVGAYQDAYARLLTRWGAGAQEGIACAS